MYSSFSHHRKLIQPSRQVPNGGPGDGQTLRGLVGQEKVSWFSRVSYPIPISEFIMSISKCIVRLKDCHNTEHSVEVYAESLYEAVLRGLNRLQDVGWECNSEETIKRVEGEIHQEPTRHIVDVPRLLKWVQEDAGYPAQQTRKEKVRKLLSTPQDQGRVEARPTRPRLDRPQLR